jgi:hypothetical protein
MCSTLPSIRNRTSETSAAVTRLKSACQRTGSVSSAPSRIDDVISPWEVVLDEVEPACSDEEPSSEPHPRGATARVRAMSVIASRDLSMRQTMDPGA